jgi:hypothetical protein
MIVAATACGCPCPAAAGGTPATFLVPAAALERLVPPGLVPVIAQLRPAAARAVHAQRGDVAKVDALRDVVRAGMAPGSAACFGYATVMATLGRQLGLPVRLATGSDGFNEYDTHATVEVWSAAERRWVISDPTFGGAFVRRGTAFRLGVADLRDAAATGATATVEWLGSHGRNAVRPSTYYVDPVYLFRYVGVYARVGSVVEPAVLPDSTMLAWVSRAGATVEGYETTPVDGGAISPIVGGGAVQLGGAGPATVRVFAVRKFPAVLER